MERTTNYINLWFWARNDATVPASVSSGAGSVDTRTFGEPYANFVNNSCNMNTYFGPEAIIINLTLCTYPFDSKIAFQYPDAFHRVKAETGLVPFSTVTGAQERAQVG